MGQGPYFNTQAFGGIFILPGELVEAIVSAGPFLSAAFDIPIPLPMKVNSRTPGKSLRKIGPRLYTQR